jgi:hypothetical protein
MLFMGLDAEAKHRRVCNLNLLKGRIFSAAVTLDADADEEDST